MVKIEYSLKQQLLNKIKNNHVLIGVIGLGYVGLLLVAEEIMRIK